MQPSGSVMSKRGAFAFLGEIREGCMEEVVQELGLKGRGAL